jgi:hypothetical protein
MAAIAMMLYRAVAPPSAPISAPQPRQGADDGDEQDDPEESLEHAEIWRLAGEEDGRDRACGGQDGTNQE